MQRSSSKIEFAVLLLLLAPQLLVPRAATAASTAAVYGVVRNAQGTVQIGAMVQIFAAGSPSVATTFTDLFGRYHITNLVPGKYDVRASAPLFAPAVRNLHLTTGARATVNLTLAMLSGAADWLPARGRMPDEPEDDWTWTLRSAANRSVLRLLGDGRVVLADPEESEASGTTSAQAHASLTGNSGEFGAGTLQTALALDTALAGGSDVVLRSAVSTPAPQTNRPAAVEIDTAYERSAPLGAASRVVVSYRSCPEISSGNVTGMQVMRLAGAEKMKLGDAIDVEAGGTVYAVHMSGSALTSQPFVRVTVHPGEVWAVRYSLAAARDLQSFDGLDSVNAQLPAAAIVNGRLRTAAGLHQEIALSRKLGSGMIQAALYHDTVQRSTLNGASVLEASDRLPGSTPLTADLSTNSFRVLGMGYTADGVSVLLAEPLAQDLLATLEYRSGAALAARDTLPVSLPELFAGLRPQAGESATASLKARLPRTGTRLWSAYRWQPRRLLTSVGAYQGATDQGYLSLYVRQALHWADRIPPGFEARIDVTNLLAQGYQPFLSADGRTLFLAQCPRTLQAGLSFTF